MLFIQALLQNGLFQQHGHMSRSHPRTALASRPFQHLQNGLFQQHRYMSFHPKGSLCFVPIATLLK